jgi:hypothetical protein
MSSILKTDKRRDLDQRTLIHVAARH